MKIIKFGTYLGAEPELEKPTAKFFFSPSDVEKEMLGVDSGVDELALNMKKVNATQPLDPAFVSSYSRFFWEWKKWLKNNDTFMRKHERGVYEGVLEYRYRLAQWRAKYEAIGGKTPGVSLQSTPPVTQSTPGEDLKGIMKMATVLVAVVAVGGIVSSIVSSIGSASKSVTPARA